MKSFDWNTITRAALAEHLRTGKINDTQALPGANLYHCQHEERDSLAISLEAGVCLLIEIPVPANPGRERRKKKTLPPELDE
ncbi:MAG: hypothetical protein WAZ34_06395 [Rhodocyclaceae bacterium]